MRPIFIIYLFAGITLFFAIVSTLTNIGYTLVTHHAIATLNLTGDDLDRMRRAISEDLESTAATFVPALFQSTIIIFARKLSKQSK
jgi:ABC-type siderophore export system fused ATPase/permease subunit